jgi:uncharacterized SAM-binding protein YcdF (DUF218 family)
VLLIRFAIASLLVILLGIFLTFPFHEPHGGRPVSGKVGIVFTGAHERIHAGLDLLAAGAVQRLFISGANPDAGVWLSEFKRQFGGPAKDGLIDCCVEFGELAETTFQNGLESRCWLEAAGIREPVVLVTSANHLPRSMAALSYFSRVETIVPFPVPEVLPSPEEALRSKTSEFVKFLGTWVALRAPRSLVSDVYGVFLNGCPHADE